MKKLLELMNKFSKVAGHKNIKKKQLYLHMLAMNNLKIKKKNNSIYNTTK